MSYEVLLLGLLVGVANYCFRYLPLRLRVGNARPTKRGAVGILLDTIGIASICALLVVSTAPEVMHDTRRFVYCVISKKPMTHTWQGIRFKLCLRCLAA